MNLCAHWFLRVFLSPLCHNKRWRNQSWDCAWLQWDTIFYYLTLTKKYLTSLHSFRFVFKERTMRRSRERSLRSARSELCDAVGSGLYDRQGANYATQSGAVFTIGKERTMRRSRERSLRSIRNKSLPGSAQAGGSYFEPPSQRKEL
jgi:hypothetical protein